MLKSLLKTCARKLISALIVTAVVPTLLAGGMLITHSDALAHEKSQSFSKWRSTEKGIAVIFTVAARQVTLLPPINPNAPSLERTLGQHLDDTITLSKASSTSKDPCIASGFTARKARPGFISMENYFICPDKEMTEEIKDDDKDADTVTIGIASFMDYAETHIHFAQFKNETGQYRGYLFNYDRRQDVLSLETDGNMIAEDIGLVQTFFQYSQIGITHILSGFDHLVFLLGLLLLTNRLRDVVLVVTGFTIGHSLTLALSVMNIVSTQSAIVEGLIGFTILVVAAEAVMARRNLMWLAGGVFALILFFMGLYSITLEAPMPINGWAGLMLFAVAYGFYSQNLNTVRQTLPILVVIFGLVHGFGFAGILVEAGLPNDRLLTALIGFNMGVEVGQLLIVGLIWYGFFRYMHTRFSERLRGAVIDLGGIAMCGIGMFWFASRLLI